MVAEQKPNGTFEGQIVVFSGFRNANWQAYIVKEGGRIKLGVDSSTTLLIHTDEALRLSNYTKAQQFNINTITRSDFAERYIVR